MTLSRCPTCARFGMFARKKLAAKDVRFCKGVR
jgi:hypothetical protein